MWEREEGGENERERNRERFTIWWFTPQMRTTSRSGPDGNQSQTLHPETPWFESSCAVFKKHWLTSWPEPEAELYLSHSDTGVPSQNELNNPLP